MYVHIIHVLPFNYFPVLCNISQQGLHTVNCMYVHSVLAAVGRWLYCRGAVHHRALALLVALEVVPALQSDHSTHVYSTNTKTVCGCSYFGSPILTG